MANTNRFSFERGSEDGAANFHGPSENVGAPLETIGQDLRAAREGFGLDLQAVSQSLKIRVEHLAALEDSNSEGLPGRPYAIGFIRSYASYLGLDPVRSVERFKAEIAGRGNTTEAQLTYPSAERRLPQSVVLVLMLLLITAIAYGGYYLLIAANRVAEQPVAALPERLAPQPPQPAPSPIAPSVAAPAAPGDAADAPPADAEAEAAPLPVGRAYGTQNTNSRITLRVHQPVKILVEAAGNPFINRTLDRGDLYQVPNLVGLTISTPDSGAVEVILDGMSLGFLGAKGAIANGLSLNPNDLVDRTGQGRAG
jgi:cytoskeleton protein RodZ